MKRRHFLQYSIVAKARALSPRFDFIQPRIGSSQLCAETYQRATMLIRAQRSCNISMVERLLNIDTPTSALLRQQLLQDGIIHTTKSAYGMHQVLKPIVQNLLSRRAVFDYFRSKPEKPNSTLINKLSQIENLANESPIEPTETNTNSLKNSEQHDIKAEDLNS